MSNCNFVRKSSLLALLSAVMALSACSDSSIRGCTTGSEQACDRLLQSCLRGHCLPEELSGAVQIFQKSCEGGTAKGCDNLLELCMPMYRVCSAEQSSAAAQVFQKACEAGNAKRCTSLGLLTKDDEKAFELFQKACDGGDGEGCRFVAQHLALNSSSAAEMAQIVHFYQLACDRDDGAGCLNLGNFYEHGTGVPKDSAKASILYKKGFDLSRKAGIAVDVAPPPK